jgi:hypothetical protein
MELLVIAAIAFVIAIVVRRKFVHRVGIKSMLHFHITCPTHRRSTISKARLGTKLSWWRSVLHPFRVQRAHIGLVYDYNRRSWSCRRAISCSSYSI